MVGSVPLFCAAGGDGKKKRAGGSHLPARGNEVEGIMIFSNIIMLLK